MSRTNGRKSGKKWETEYEERRKFTQETMVIEDQRTMAYELDQTPARSAESLGNHDTSQAEDLSNRNSPMPPNAMADTPLSPSQEKHAYLTGLKLAAVVGSTTLVVFLILLDVSIISTAVPRITSDFHSLDDVGWYAAAYQLTSASFQPLSGKFYTYFSTKWTFILFVLLFEVGSLVCGIASSSDMFIGGRAIAGIGGSGIINGGLTMISAAVPTEKRALFTSIMMGFGQLGLIAGPLVGGALTEYTTWRWCFYINLPVGFVALIFLIFVKVPDITNKAPFTLALVKRVIPELDLIGFALLVPAALMFLLGLQFGGTDYAWNSSVIIGLFCGAGVAAILFVFWERHVGDRAMIPGSVVKDRIAYSSALQGMFLLGTVFVGSYYLPIYFQAVLGVGPTLSGVDLLPSFLSQLLVTILSGWLTSKLGYYLPWPIAAGVLSAVGNGLVSTFSPTTSTGKWIGYQLILGAGRGAGMQMALIAIQNCMPGRQIPVAIAFQVFCQNLMGALLLAVASVIFTQSLGPELAQHAPSVTAEAASAAGGSASAVRALVPAGSPELEGLLLAYSNSIARVFYMLTALAVLSFFAAFGMGWKDTRKKNGPEKGSP
ncbi:major facilitator superfamily domain-containing protein [Xylariales sp. AK1849]|nr:major facilitator superfamily domain-containing protein [Xylariales sp. AK1849]